MAYRYAFPEDEPLEPMPEDSIFREMLKRGQATSEPVPEIMRGFNRSVQSVLAVEVGPALEGPNEPEQVPRLIDKASDQLTGINVLFRRFIQVEDTQDLRRLSEVINLLEGMTQTLKEVKAA